MTSRPAVGNRHACGLTGERELYCWGSNDVAQLGTGSRGDGVP